MTNKILENNLETLYELEGLTLEEIIDKGKKEGLSDLYRYVIKSSFRLFAVGYGTDNVIWIDDNGNVTLWVVKFTLDLRGYEIVYSDNDYNSVEQAINNVRNDWLREQLIKAHNYAKFKEYGDKLQQLVDLGFEIEEIDTLDIDWEIRIRFKENDSLSTKTAMFFKWPLDCIPYLRERFNLPNNEE